MADTAKSTVWTPDDSKKASAQGWGVFECGGEHQLQRDEESSIFLTDDAAAAYVRSRAGLGDELAQKAISHLVSCGSDDIALFALV